MDFDQDFIKRLVEHDELAFATFYEKSVDVFCRYVVSHYSLSEEECQDVVSSVYLKIRNGLEKYRSEYSFGQFVWGILKNHCKDYFKKLKPVLFSELSDELEHTTPLYQFEEESDDLFQFSVDASILKYALLCLDQESQELIHARFVLGYDYDTMADMFIMSSSSIRQKISRILKKLRLTLSHIK